MPSTKDIENFRKYLNRTLREDFLEDLKKEETVLHGAIETTTAESMEMQKALDEGRSVEEAAEAAKSVGLKSLDESAVSENNPIVIEDIFNDEPKETIDTNERIEPEESIESIESEESESPLTQETPSQEEISIEEATSPKESQKNAPLPEELDLPLEDDSLSENNVISTETPQTDNLNLEDQTPFSDDELNDYLNMDWAKTTEDLEKKSEEDPLGDFASEILNEETPSTQGEGSPASFFTSTEETEAMNWDDNLFENPVQDDNYDNQQEGGLNLTGEPTTEEEWSSIDLGEIPDNLEEMSFSDDQLDLEAPPAFAKTDESENVTFEEKFGETKRTPRKKKVNYEISDREAKVIFNYLAEFPRNVKIACEEFITSENNDPNEVVELIELLKEEESIKVIVRFLEEKTGEHIDIPRGFEKINGKAYWEMINSPAYIFRTKVLPVIVKSAIAVLFALFTIAASITLFIPASHGSLVYRSGYRDIKNEDYAQSMEKFHKAFEIWPSRGWSYKYAERYIEKRQYILAEEIYDNLLDEDYRPYDRRGRLDYCRFESELMGNYQKADQIIQEYLDFDRTDAGAHLEAARNFLRWSYFDKSRLESGRMEIVAAGENHKYTDEVMFEMLHYMILSDRYDDVLQMWESYQNKPRTKLDLEIFGKLAGYFIDQEEKELANAVIKRMYKQEENNRNAHFQWARLSRIESEWASMENAANKVLYQLAQLPYLTRDTLSMKILSLNMKAMGEYKKSEYLLTQRDLEEAIGLYENAVTRNILKKEPCYGELYYNLGNLFYYTAEEYETAFSLYEKSQDSHFHNSDIVYKKGYIEYQRGDYRSALLEFAEAASVFSSNPNLLYATGNTFFRRNDFFSALAHYYHTADLLEKQKDSIRGYDPQNRVAHYRTIDGLSMVYNNIGATLFGVYRTTGDHSKYVQALANLQKATEYRDILFRNRSTLEGINLEGSLSRVNTENLLESDNMKAALYPATNNSVQIYEQLPKDMEVDIFGFH